MKKVVLLATSVIVIVSMLSLTICATAMDNGVKIEESNYTIYINNEEILFENVKNKTINGIEMIPLRFTSEMLGWEVEWISETRRIKMKDRNKTNFVDFVAEGTPDRI